jgi:hypothetical protein
MAAWGIGVASLASSDLHLPFSLRQLQAELKREPNAAMVIGKG